MAPTLADFRTLRHPAQPAEVVAIVAGLLQRASVSLHRDTDTARRDIQTAVDLLSGTGQPPKVLPTSAERPRSALASWQMRAVIDHIEAHLETTLLVEDMAGVTRLSASYFFRAFKRSFGMAPHAYVTSLRLARARALLLESEAQLCAVALACGFADQAHFSRVFQRATGCSPGKWRREQRSLAQSAPSFSPISGPFRQ
jgi:transcriptional regulator GlxA family with amidase domain